MPVQGLGRHGGLLRRAQATETSLRTEAEAASTTRARPRTHPAGERRGRRALMSEGPGESEPELRVHGGLRALFS